MKHNFKENKYTKWYYSIINNAKSLDRKKSKDNYFEKHHIIPKCLGGDNSKDNLVLLTAREHYICHWLLSKLTEHPKLISAFWMMNTIRTLDQPRYINSKAYQLIRINFSKLQSELKKGKPNLLLRGRKHSDETKKMIGEKSKGRGLGRKQSDETKRKIGDAQLGEKNHNYGQKASLEKKKKLSENASKHFLGKKHKEETIKKISESNKGKIPWNKGVERDSITKAKISETLKNKKDRINPMQGKNHSEETKRKISETKKANKLGRTAQLRIYKET